MVSILCCAWCVEWRWCVLLLACTVRRCGPCSARPGAVLVSAAVVSCTVHCRVCGVRVVSVPLRCRVVGYPPITPPSSWWWVGALWMVGWHDGAGWHGVEGRVP